MPGEFSSSSLWDAYIVHISSYKHADGPMVMGRPHSTKETWSSYWNTAQHVEEVANFWGGQVFCSVEHCCTSQQRLWQFEHLKARTPDLQFEWVRQHRFDLFFPWGAAHRHGGLRAPNPDPGACILQPKRALCQPRWSMNRSTVNQQIPLLQLLNRRCL